jgi:hypothetical protein
VGKEAAEKFILRVCVWKNIWVLKRCSPKEADDINYMDTVHIDILHGKRRRNIDSIH